MPLSLLETDSGPYSQSPDQRQAVSLQHLARRVSTVGPLDDPKFLRAKSLPEYSSRDPYKVRADDKENTSQFFRVRSFKSTRKGLVRNGDSVSNKDSSAFVFTGRIRSYRQPEYPEYSERSGSKDSSDSATTVDSIGGSSIAESYYRVGVLGAPKVGKTALVTRFLASDDDGDSMTVDEEEVARKTVSVLLDGEESLMEFFDDLEEMNLVCPLCNPSNTGNNPSNPQENTLDQQTCNVTASNHITPVVDDGRSTFLDINPPCLPPGHTTFTPVMESLTCDNVACHCDAYAVVFSVTDLQSFRWGRQKVRHLREDLGTDRSIILVGNKADLVRKRCVSAKEAMMLACKYDCKYIETSAVFGHQTDELLVGILRQISRRLSTPPSHHDDEDITDAARKRSKWRKLSKLRKFLEKATKAKDPCCDILT